MQCIVVGNHSVDQAWTIRAVRRRAGEQEQEQGKRRHILATISSTSSATFSSTTSYTTSSISSATSSYTTSSTCSSFSPCPGCFWGSCAVRRTEWPGQWMAGLKYVSIIIMMLGFSKIFSFLLCFPEPKGFSIFWSYIHLIWSGVLSKTIVTFLKIRNSKEGKKNGHPHGGS